MSYIKIKRVDSLDWLRGLMACSIMFYHLLGWENVHLDSDSILGRLGIYGVSIFFILSGLSMAIVYNSILNNLHNYLIFIVRRIFRIWPLLWLVTLFIFFEIVISEKKFGYKLLALNLSTLFGFIKPSAYMAIGAWSIGNEMVYYVLTPIIIYFFNYKISLGNFFLLVCFLITLVFAFYFLDSSVSISNQSQWIKYINPFNNLFLYVSGLAIYYNFKDKDFNSRIIYVTLLVTSLLFCFLPFDGDQINIVTGFGRVIFLLLSILIVICIYKFNFQLPFFLNKPFEILGLATYGIYLLHPVIYFTIKDHFMIKDGLLIIVPIITIIAAIFLYHHLEVKFINIGKKVSKFN